ncbi:hypothetical protein [Maribacter antarcticus]|uniref:hypothetical protein n=1 Tax=Maribacter antarcticus TaxID=505250 RepID=UPI0004791145|nr:hypothetical protein [Maribacter antarcticus]
MKCLCILLFFSFSYLGSAQTPDETVKNTVDSFFKAFHARDGKGMNMLIHADARLQRTAPNAEGIQSLRAQNFQDLIAGIVSMPDSTVFEEKLLSYAIQIDGPLAHVWTPYEFWLDAELHHSGANSIQLFLDEGNWKIIYLVDSRTSEGLKE